MGSELTHLQRSEDALECGESKLVEGGRDGLFVSMPSRKTVDGYSEVCFPVTAEFREQLYGKVLGAYRQVMREVQTAAVQGYGSPPPGREKKQGMCRCQ